jgi:hypothetical protein
LQKSRTSGADESDPAALRVTDVLFDETIGAPLPSAVDPNDTQREKVMAWQSAQRMWRVLVGFLIVYPALLAGVVLVGYWFSVPLRSLGVRRSTRFSAWISQSCKMTFKSLEWRPFTLLLPDIMLTFALPVALIVVLEALQSKSDQNSGIVNVAHGSEKYARYLPKLTMLLVASTSMCPYLQATGPSISVLRPASQQPSQTLAADNRPSHSSKRLGSVNMASTIAAVNRHGL